jgi:Fis family transcriptional regulator
VTAYLETLEGYPSSGLYDLVRREVEVPLFRVVLAYTRGNLSQAAKLLGLSRATLRKKPDDHGLL